MKVTKICDVALLALLLVSTAYGQEEAEIVLNPDLNHTAPSYGFSDLSSQNQDVGWGVRLNGATPALPSFNSSDTHNGLSMPLRIGQGGLRSGLRNVTQILRQGREIAFTKRFGNTPVGESSLNSTRLDSRLQAFCAHLAANKPDSETPAGCDFDGSNALDKCDLGAIITENEIGRLKRMISMAGSNKQQECVDRFKELSNITLSVAGHITQATIQSATNLEDPDAALDTTPSTGECIRDGKIGTCNDFNNTPFAGSEMSGFMSKFISDFDGFGNFWKIFKLRGTTGECEACFADKYKTVQQISNLPSDDFNSQYAKKLADSKIALRVRKAEQALSEYIKFQERNLFMSRYMSAQPETCGNIAELSRLVRGCDPEQAKQVLGKIAQKHGVRASTEDLPLFVNQLRTLHMNKLQSPEATPECGEGVRVTHASYLSTYQTQISSTPMQPSFLFTSKTKTELQKCGEYDQRCMLDVMTKALHAQKGGLEVDSRRTILSFFRQPFYRTLLTNRQSLLDYADSGDVNESNSLSMYKEANKDRFAEIARRDAEVACKAFGKDFMLALCVKDDDLSESYSGQGLKQELAEMLAAGTTGTNPGDAGKNLVNLTVACNMINQAGNFNTEINESQAISDQAFDRLELADSFLRNNLREPSRVSQKKEAFFQSYAKKMCADALEEKKAAEREAMLAQQTPVSTPSYSSSSICLTKIILPGVPCTMDFVSSTFEKYDILGFSSISTISIPPTNNLGRLSSNKKSSLVYSGSSFNSSSSDFDLFDDRDDGSARYDSGFKSTTSMALAPNAAPGDAVSVSAKNESIAGAAPTEGGFLQSAGEMAAQFNVGSQTNPMAVVPSWTMPIPDTTMPARGIASISEEEEGGVIGRRRGASERSIQEIEARQTAVEQQVLAQAKETQTIQDLKNQAQIEQLRIELQKLQLSNKQLMSNIQKLSAPRKTQSEENIFDQSVAEEDEETFDVIEPAPTRPVSRGVAQNNGVKADVTAVARTNLDGSTVVASSARLPEQGKVNKPTTSSTAAVAANVGVARGGTQAAASRGAASGAGVSFVPSISLQRTITSETTQEVIPQEKKIELLKEFLSYVEKNPEYKDGRYLSSENDRVTIEYEGRTVILSVTDIQDNKARSHLQERLLRQRMVINQYVRASRLENLKRLLASTRAQQ